MKFLFVLAFLAAVSAVPRLQQIPENGEVLQLWGPSEGSGDGDIPSENGSSSSSPKPPENPDESDEDDSDEDDDDSDEINIVDLINGIREAIKKKIHDKLSQNKTEDSDEDDVSFPGDEDNSNGTAPDAPLPGNGTEGPSSIPPPPVAGNNTVSNHRPNINVTAIKKEIHDRIENILSNILGPLLGNNSAVDSDPENVTAVNPPQPGNNSEPPSNEVASNETVSSPQEEGPNNDSAVVAPQPGNSTVPPPEDASNSGNETEIVVNEPAIVGSEVSSVSEVSRGIRPNVESASQSQVRFVNTVGAVQPQAGVRQFIPKHHLY